jgi:hypothetical protein
MAPPLRWEGNDMKSKLGVLFGLLLASANAMACYTVYDGNNRVVYRGLQAPVDMSLPLHQALEGRFPPGASLVFDQSPVCSPVGIAQVARPTGPMVPSTRSAWNAPAASCPPPARHRCSRTATRPCASTCLTPSCPATW